MPFVLQSNLVRDGSGQCHCAHLTNISSGPQTLNSPRLEVCSQLPPLNGSAPPADYPQHNSQSQSKTTQAKGREKKKGHENEDEKKSRLLARHNVLCDIYSSWHEPFQLRIRETKSSTMPALTRTEHSLLKGKFLKFSYL